MKGKKEEDKGEAKLYKWVFGISGPVHLTSIDWRKLEHKRSVLASLVQGVYVLERDRQNKRSGHKALAPPWWDFFHFQCVKTLVDHIDSSIFGAIFEHKINNNNASNYYYQQGAPPRFVIAFRGTLIEPATRKRDLSLDIKVPLNGLSMDSRYHMALQVIQDTMIQTSPKNVVLVGHSLGAAIALQAGKDMARRGHHVETYLFNPPYTSAPIEMISNSDLKGKVRVTKSTITAGVYKVVKKQDYRDKSNLTKHNNESIYSLRSWVPNLFVNPKDPLCCEYIGHFEHRGRLKEMGREEVDVIATKNSLLSMLAGAFGRDSEPPHLIPSALLHKNMIILDQSVKDAHCIDQWWKPHPHWHSKLYVWE